jgi:hypothetical protein
LRLRAYWFYEIPRLISLSKEYLVMLHTPSVPNYNLFWLF